MRNRSDPMALLRAPLDGERDPIFDPDSPAARSSLERILAAGPLPAAHGRRSSRRRLALAAVPVALAGGALAVALSLSPSRTGIARAALLQRAAAALEQPGTITYLQVQQYSAHEELCMAGGHGRPMCFGASSGAPNASISANPSEDTLFYSAREWLSPGGSEEHIIYSNGDESQRNSETHEYEAYDAAQNTLSILTDTGQGLPAAPRSSAPSPRPSISEFADPSYYESLYHQVQHGGQNAQLLGQSTIDGTSVYELRFDITPPVPAHPPAGDLCDGKVCTPPQTEILLYLDSKTFTPVRTVQMVSNTNDLPGLPKGTSVLSVTDYRVQRVPATPANEDLLQISSHPGATRIRQTEAQWRAELGRDLGIHSTASAEIAGASRSHP